MDVPSLKAHFDLLSQLTGAANNRRASEGLEKDEITKLANTGLAILAEFCIDIKRIADAQEEQVVALVREGKLG